MNKKTTIILVVAVNLILIASIIALYFTVFNNNTNEWSLTITGEVENDVVLSIDELVTLPNITRSYLLQGNPTFTAEYTGVSLNYLITEIANITENVRVRVIAVDQYSYTFNFENDLVNNSEIIIAYLKNGEYIKSRSKGGEGPLRLIIPQRFEGEFNGQYCVKYVNTIEILAV
ncbi:MAG: molybdopterin-dependent oxidoreductase [Candidatus Thorarchaeota archaeon]